MPASSATNMRPAPNTARKRMVADWLAIGVFMMAMVVLPIGVEVGIRVIPPDAVQVRATSGPTGRTLTSRVVTDPPVVADVYTRINSLPSTNGATYHCSLPGVDSIVYHFGFMRWGVLIEAATPPAAGCGVWSVSRGGLDDPRLDTTDAKRAIISEVQPLLPLR